MGFSMSDLSTEGGISPGTLYRIVNNKSDILVHIFIGCLSKRLEMALIMKELPLTAKERFLVWNLYPSYLSEYRDKTYDYGVTILGSNQSVLSHSSPELIEKLNVIVSKNMATDRGLYEDMLKAGDVSSSSELTKSVFLQSITASRGVHVMSSNQLILPGKGHQITQSGISLLMNTLSQLDWGKLESVNEQRIMMAMRTGKDLSSTEAIWKGGLGAQDS